MDGRNFLSQAPLSVSQTSQAAGARIRLGVEPVLGPSHRPVRSLAFGRQAPTVSSAGHCLL